MDQETRNADHRQCGGASNVIPFGWWNSSKSNLKSPQRQIPAIKSPSANSLLKWEQASAFKRALGADPSIAELIAAEHKMREFCAVFREGL